MTAWLRANPKKAVNRNFERFATGWLSRQHGRGGDAKSNRPDPYDDMPPRRTSEQRRALLESIPYEDFVSNGAKR